MKVLITGANGFLGKKISKIFLDRGAEIICTDKSASSNGIFLDVTNKENVERVLVERSPEVVIHTAAITAVDWCEMHKEETFKVNFDGTKNLVFACKKVGAKMVLISTDYVFDGAKNEPYVEEDKKNPVNVYADSKLEAEKIVKAELEDYLIVRVTVLYGYNAESDKKSFPTHVIDALKKKKEFSCFVEQYSNPTLINDIAEALFGLLKQNQCGVFHMTGSENINRLDFAKKIAQVFDLDEGLLSAGSWEESGFIAKRPPKLNVSIEKLAKQGITMSNTTDGLKKMKEDMETL